MISLDKAWIRWGLLILFWNLVALAFLVQYFVFHLTEGIPFLMDRAVRILIGWYVWIPLTPLVVHLARRYQVHADRWVRTVLLHLAIATFISFVEVGFYTVIYTIKAYIQSDPDFSASRHLRIYFLRSVIFDTLLYMCIVAIVHAIDIERKYRERDVKMATLETRLAETQLNALRSQLNPHFLFNTLHTVSIVMEENIKSARRIILDLSDLLRMSLDDMREQLVPLKREVDFTRRYLAIEKERFQERLTVHYDLDEKCLTALVPNLILQPIVENAIKHGIAPFSGGGSVWISARCDDEFLTLQVRDDGPGIIHPKPPQNGSNHRKKPGIGIHTTRERLQYLFADEAEFSLVNLPEGGLLVTMTFPCCMDVLESLPEE